jgi:hypothetical protein
MTKNPSPVAASAIPKVLANLMVNLGQAQSDNRILEPYLGQGEVLRALAEKGIERVTAYGDSRRVIEQLKVEFPTFSLEHKDFLVSTPGANYDLAIGRSPYVVWADIYKNTKRILTQKKFWRALTSSDWDLLYAYIIWQIEQLAPGGRLVVLCPVTWFTNHGGGGLRRYLARNVQLETLISLGLQSGLGDTSAVWAVLVFCKETPDAKKRTRIVEITQKNCNLELVLPSVAADLEKIPAERSYERSRSAYRFYNRRNFLTEESWYLATPAEEAAIRALEDSAPLHLGEVVDLSLGPISGANEAFALSEEEVAAIPNPEQKLVRYFVRAEHCKRWRVTGSAAYLWPNEISDLDELKITYPTIFSRLTSFMQTLSARYLPANRPWWHWATIRGVGSGEISGGHLFVPGSTSNAPARYSYAKDSALFGLGDLLTISAGKQNKEHLLYILAWLNSGLVERWYQIKGAQRAGRLRYSIGQVSEIPYRPINRNDPAELKIHNDVVKLVQKILTETNEDQISEIERQINLLIGRLLAKVH